MYFVDSYDENIDVLIPSGTPKAERSSLLYIANWSSVGVSTVVLGLLTIPVIVLTALTLIIRARRTGWCHLILTYVTGYQG